MDDWCELYKNANYPDHTVFRKIWILGENHYQDKYRTELVGFVILNKETNKWEVKQYTPYYDEDNDITVDSDTLLKEFDTEQEAIDYAMEFWNIRKVVE